MGAHSATEKRLDRERNRLVHRSHVDLTYGRAQRQTQSRWQTSQAAVFEQNLSEKFDCEKQPGQQGSCKPARTTNINLGNDAGDFSDRESRKYVWHSSPAQPRNADGALPAVAGARPVQSFR